MYLNDSAVASMLSSGFPAGDIQSWDDEDKNKFLTLYLQVLTRSQIAEIFGEAAAESKPWEMANLFSDPLAFHREFSNGVYLYLESELFDQIERARKLIAKRESEDYSSGLKFAARG